MRLEPIFFNKKNNNIFISIITPVYNRENEIIGLLDSIEKQTIRSNEFELIVVDDGSTDSTIFNIESKINHLNYNIRLIKQENAGPGAARNCGVEQSKGDLIIFIDSDCEADSNWLEMIIKCFETEKFDAFGGPDSAKTDFSLLQRAINFSLTSFLTTGGLRGHSNRPLAKFYPRSHNMGITRSLYNRVGGFGSLRHGQDIELSQRIINSGAKVVNIPEAIVYHRRRTTLLKFFRQVFNWGVARINLGKKNNKMLEPLHFAPAIITIVASLITFYFFVDPINNGRLFELGLGFLMFVSGVGAWYMKDIRGFFLLLFIIPIQIFGYGLGFILAFIHRFIFRRSKWSGFTKSYY